MNKKRIRRSIAISMSTLFVLLAVSCKVAPSPVVDGRIEGKVQQITPIARDFESLGIFFVTATARYDNKGILLEGSYITYEMLMKETQKLGGNDFMNLRIDNRIDPKAKTNIYTASALAIRYKDKVPAAE